MQNSAARNCQDRLVLVTGGASGVGFEAARLFQALGAKIHLVGRSEPKLEAATESLGGENSYSVGDVGDASFAKMAFDEATQAHSLSVSILINNAGTILRANAEDTTDEEWQGLMKTNVDGVFYFSREYVNQAGLEHEGSIVNVSSTCGQVGAAGLAAYCASKGAVDQLTRSMALELAARQITVNAVAPGAINSPMLYSKHDQGVSFESVVDSNCQLIPLGRIAEAEEVARSIVFLASERHITGTILSVDGGYTCL